MSGCHVPIEPVTLTEVVHKLLQRVDELESKIARLELHVFEPIDPESCNHGKL